MNNQETTTRKIIIPWDGLVYDDEVPEEAGVPGLGWHVDGTDPCVEYWEGEKRLEPTPRDFFPSVYQDLVIKQHGDDFFALACASPCFTKPEHAIGHFLSHLPPEWRAAEIVLPDDVDELMEDIAKATGGAA